jgi:uncharacterized membrane protein
MPISHPLWIVAVLGLNVALSEWLVRRTALRHMGSALLVILLTAVAANAGLVPTYSDEIPVYSGVFEFLAPLAIFLLLLRVHLAGLMKAGRTMLLLFGLGALGTVIGVVVGMWVAGGATGFGELHYALGGMFVGTYTGGSINFNAVALEYGVVENGVLYAGAAAVDNVATAVWMAATVTLPRLLGRWGAGRVSAAPGASVADSLDEAERAESETEKVAPFDLAVLLALGSASVWLSDWTSAGLEALAGVGVPSILVLTTLALALAQLRPVQRLRGTKVCGWLAVMVFLAVIGALCDLSALQAIGPLAWRLTLFVGVTVLLHGVVVFGLGGLLGVDPAMSAVASQANIGGSTSALALAKSLGRTDLMLPAILIGSLGNAAGTYIGFLTAAWLR